MKRRIIAAALAGLAAVPAAHAQSSNVQLYGRVNVGLDNYSATGARGQGALSGSAIDFESRFRVFDSLSRVGLRGTEDLGNGLKAVFQIESGVNVDAGGTNGQNGQANVSSGTFASRDSFVGLDSGWGRITFGRQSIYWVNGELAQYFANYVNQEVPWTNGTMLGRISRGGAAVARQANTVQYTTPTFSGFNATLSYSPNDQETVQNNNIADTDGQIWGATLRGRLGAFHGQFDYVNKQGNTDLATGLQFDYDGYKAGVGWKYRPGANVSLIWVRNETNGALGVAPGRDVTQDGYTINWEHTFGNIQALAQYGWTDSMKGCAGNEGTPAGAAGTVSCSDTKSQAWLIGARYLLSKRTWLYLTWNEIDNDANQFADWTGGNVTSVSSTAIVPYGADPRLIALGVFHAF
jgi:predicted porin